MLSWSDTQYKFTFGIGSLATTAVMAELWDAVLSVWVILPVALLPLSVFVFVRPDEMPVRFVRVAHVFASVWYVLTVAVVSVGLCLAPELPRGWFILPVFCAVGLLPAGLVLAQAVRGRYREPGEQDDESRPVG